jgi:hypothetical protein
MIAFNTKVAALLNLNLQNFGLSKGFTHRKKTVASGKDFA